MRYYMHVVLKNINLLVPGLIRLYIHTYILTTYCYVHILSSCFIFIFKKIVYTLSARPYSEVKYINNL